MYGEKEKGENKAPRQVRYVKRASVTIEASLLMPLILGSIVFVIYMGFYLHGRCMLQKAEETAILRGGNERAKEERVAAGELALKEITEKKLFGPWQVETDVKAYEGLMTVEIEGKMRYDGGRFSGGSASDGLGYYRFKLYNGFDSGNYIRSVKKRGKGYAASGTD